jgi:hypothetical protein
MEIFRRVPQISALNAANSMIRDSMDLNAMGGCGAVPGESRA